MKKMVVGMALALTMSACSSYKEPQEFVVNTNPQGAQCVLSRGTQTLATVNTPATLRIPRNKAKLTIVCDKDGFAPTTYVDQAPAGSNSVVKINLEPKPMRDSSMIMGAGGMAISPPLPVVGNAMGLRDDKNIILRFQTLRVLLDDGLITPEEYQKRRGANLGALLPYTARPADRDLGRAAPPAEQLVGRLRFLADAYAEHSISANEQSVERTMILEMLAPENSIVKASPPPPLTDRLQAATAVGRLERLREANVITDEEKAREKAAILRLVDANIVAAEASARVAAGEVDAPKAAFEGPWIKLAAYGSEKQAVRAWAGLQKAYPTELAGFTSAITPHSLHHRPPTYTLTAGPTADLVSATALCHTLERHAVSCQPIVAAQGK